MTKLDPKRGARARAAVDAEAQARMTIAKAEARTRQAAARAAAKASRDATRPTVATDACPSTSPPFLTPRNAWPCERPAGHESASRHYNRNAGTWGPALVLGVPRPRE